MPKAEKSSHRGGSREGAGRKSGGKNRYTVTLTAKNVERAKASRSNFSGLLDRLLSEWLATSEIDRQRTKPTPTTVQP